MPVILATEEAEIRRIIVQRDSVSKIFNTKKGWSCCSNDRVHA
jgi:hypothetical protein